MDDLDIARAWREGLTLDGTTLQKCPRQDGPTGEGRGFWVESTLLPGRSLYLKPTKLDRAAFCGRAGREKICSDLAYELGLGVPPVLLARRARCPPDQEEWVCVSLRLYDQQIDVDSLEDWKHRAGPLGRAVAAHAPIASSRAWVFDTWVSQTDHRDVSPENIHFGWDPSDSSRRGFVFLDYAMSLGFKGAWASGRHLDPQVAPFPSILMSEASPERLDEDLKRVENFDEEVIEELVQRIPENYLPDHERSTIARGLKERRGKLRAMFSPLLEKK